MSKYGPRAPNGSAEKSINLRLPAALKKAAAKAAKLEEVNLTEWIREAVRMRLEGYNHQGDA